MRISDWSSDVCSSDLHSPRRSGGSPSGTRSPTGLFAGLPGFTRLRRCKPPPAPLACAASGGVAEWLKAHAWKVCRGESLSRVRIPLPPPSCFVSRASQDQARRPQRSRITPQAFLNCTALDNRTVTEFRRHRGSLRRPWSYRQPRDLAPRLLLCGADFIGALQVEPERSEEHTSELQALMRISYAVFCLK